MSNFDGLAVVDRTSIKMMGFGTAVSKAPEISTPPLDDEGRQMAAYVARVAETSEPMVVVGIVLGDQQMTVTLLPDQADQFCHALADAVLWQNDQLRQKAGQAVH